MDSSKEFHQIQQGDNQNPYLDFKERIYSHAEV